MVSALRTSSLLQVAKQELRQTKGGGRDVYAGIRDSCSRYPRGWEGEWSGRLCPTLRGPHGGTRHTPPGPRLDHSPPGQPLLHLSGCTSDQPFFFSILLVQLFKVLTPRNPRPQLASDSHPHPSTPNIGN